MRCCLRATGGSPNCRTKWSPRSGNDHALEIDLLAHRQVRVSNMICKRVMSVSPSGFTASGFNTASRTSRELLKAMEAKVAKESLIFTDALVPYAEKKHDDEACSEIKGKETNLAGKVRGLNLY